MKFADIVQNNKSDVAFIVGNGINRFKSIFANNSWDELLVELWNKHSRSNKSEIPVGIALTEFYDVLEIRHNNKPASNNLQKEFCEFMKKWRPLEHHKAFIKWATENQSPVMTTNFDNTLSDAGECTLHRSSKRRFTSYYPWESYHSINEISDPNRNFAIWHINGMQCYHQSIRLGLSHYMGSVERARKWLHKGDERRLFSGEHQNEWYGVDTWLNILFKKPIAIFGLSLGQTEVFLRWLLIERAKYFSKFPERKKEAWYIYTGDKPASGKIMFFKNLGITPVPANNYDELYIEPWHHS